MSVIGEITGSIVRGIFEVILWTCICAIGAAVKWLWYLGRRPYAELLEKTEWNGVLGIFILTAGILGGLYAHHTYYTPWKHIQDAREEINELATKGELRDGDLIFQTSLSGQSKAIQAATKSMYSHCGLIYKKDNRYMVFEAIQPVTFTPLDKWIARGKDGHYVVKRLKNADSLLTPGVMQKMREEGAKFLGKNYDLTFEWSDDRIYCSELIWKIYQRSTGIEIGTLQHLRDFDLSNGAVKKKMQERYGNKIPLDEMVISPAAVFDSNLLITIRSND